MTEFRKLRFIHNELYPYFKILLLKQKHTIISIFSGIFNKIFNNFFDILNMLNRLK
jgi:hypothetical protein